MNFSARDLCFLKHINSYRKNSPSKSPHIKNSLRISTPARLEDPVIFAICNLIGWPILHNKIFRILKCTETQEPMSLSRLGATGLTHNRKGPLQLQSQVTLETRARNLRSLLCGIEILTSSPKQETRAEKKVKHHGAKSLRAQTKTAEEVEAGTDQ